MAKTKTTVVPSLHITPYQRQQIEAMIDATKSKLLEADPDILNDQGLFVDMMDAESDVVDFMRQLGRGYVECDNWANATNERINVLKTRKERWERRGAAYKDALYSLLQVAEMTGLPDTDFTAYFQDGRPSVNKDVDEHTHEIDPRYVITERKIDKRLLLEDLKNGIKVEHARISNGEPTFVIRRK